MKNKFRLSKLDSRDIGFAISSLFRDAISLEEFKDWLDYVILNSDTNDLPIYIWDLIDFNEGLANIFDVIGFIPSSSLTVGEENALYAIALKRFGEVYDMSISKNNAFRAFELNPHILQQFKKTFPFIQLDF